MNGISLIENSLKMYIFGLQWAAQNTCLPSSDIISPNTACGIGMVILLANSFPLTHSEKH